MSALVLTRPGDYELQSGPFQGLTLAVIYGIGEEEAKDLGHRRGSGKDFVQWVASEANSNYRTRWLATAFLLDLCRAQAA